MSVVNRQFRSTIYWKELQRIQSLWLLTCQQHSIHMIMRYMLFPWVSGKLENPTSLSIKETLGQMCAIFSFAFTVTSCIQICCQYQIIKLQERIAHCTAAVCMSHRLIPCSHNLQMVDNGFTSIDGNLCLQRFLQSILSHTHMISLLFI